MSDLTGLNLASLSADADAAICVERPPFSLTVDRGHVAGVAVSGVATAPLQPPSPDDLLRNPVRVRIQTSIDDQDLDADDFLDLATVMHAELQKELAGQSEHILVATVIDEEIPPVAHGGSHWTHSEHATVAQVYPVSTDSGRLARRAICQTCKALLVGWATRP